MNNIKDILKITYESKKHQHQRPKTGNNKGQHPIKPSGSACRTEVIWRVVCV